MVERIDRDLFDGIENNLILSAGLIFQRLKHMQAIEDVLREAKLS